VHAQLPLHMQPKEVGCTHFRFLGVGSVLARCWLGVGYAFACATSCIVSANVYGYKAQLKRVALSAFAFGCNALTLRTFICTTLHTYCLLAKVLTTYDVYLYSSASLPRSELMWLLQYEIANFYVLLI
jgi:hypothetical protein